MDRNKDKAKTKGSRRRAELPPLSERDWLTEKETALRIGKKYNTLRKYRYEDQERELKGLPWIGKAPRFNRAPGGRGIRYFKVDADNWIERNSSAGPR
jgi:hypothetical protein